MWNVILCTVMCSAVRCLMVICLDVLFVCQNSSQCSGGKAVKDSETLASLGLSSGDKLYFRDLGPQVGWTTVSFAVLFYLLCQVRRECLVSSV